MSETSDGRDASPTRLVETHSAFVLLCGDRVFKWKKPVDLGFLDFRAVDAREAACRRELELNRRLAPDVYLDVAALHGSDGAPIEHVLIMRRLPDERRLASLVTSDAPLGNCLEAIAHSLAALHREQTSPQAQRFATQQAMRQNWRDNLVALRGHAGRLLDADEVEETATLALTYLDGRAELFDERAALACDGHGDLLADDVFCMDDGPRIIDCLDFTDRYRLGDPLLDAAFLAMDLEQLGRRDLADAFLGSYAEASGAPMPATLTDHFVAYRASVRAKVACLRVDQGEDEAADAARRLLDLCLQRLRVGQPALVLVGGLPGTGKTTVASDLAALRGWALLSSDVVRKELAGVGGDARLDERHYTLEARTRVYEALLDRADRLLGRGEPVIIDASWSEPSWRAAAAELAERRRTAAVPLRCETPIAIAHDRLRRRASDRREASDAGPEVLDELAARTAPWPEAIALDATGPRDAIAARADALVRAHLGQPSAR